MRWCEPIYTGEKAREHLQEYRRLLERVSEAANWELGFYVIATPANDKNLMELFPAFYLKQASYRRHSMVIMGLAADRKEAFLLCEQMVRDCYVCHGCVSRELLLGDLLEKE